MFFLGDLHLLVFILSFPTYYLATFPSKFPLILCTCLILNILAYHFIVTNKRILIYFWYIITLHLNVFRLLRKMMGCDPSFLFPHNSTQSNSQVNDLERILGYYLKTYRLANSSQTHNMEIGGNPGRWEGEMEKIIRATHRMSNENRIEEDDN